jgi:hypothetical protein
METSTFMKTLESKMIQEKDNLTKSSRDLYIKNLYRLNGKEPFNSLKFLDDFDGIIKYLDKYSLSTKKNYINSIIVALTLYKSKTKLLKIYRDYFNDVLMKDDGNGDSNKKSEKQTKNWMEWKYVMDIQKELYNVSNGLKKKKLYENDYNKLLDLVVVSLYTLQAPRRNEYRNMNVVKNPTLMVSDTLNYLDLKNKEFVFNNYKTSKKYGQQKIKINDDLMAVINKYLQYHPLKKQREYPFLVRYDGKTFLINTITKILNKILKKNIGASMLRHIYLTDKYEDTMKERMEDASLMANSVQEQQKTYIKIDDEDDK